ncbi:hypothetical protein HanIR_Chr12g0578591 [Helianthus annuus]|nr:hypothetical protein HanIR_Chr12g0578591 [Helianthus annuus]
MQRTHDTILNKHWVGLVTSIGPHSTAINQKAQMLTWVRVGLVDPQTFFYTSNYNPL